MIEVLRGILLLGLVACAVATALSKRTLRMVIIFSAYSLMMSVLWFLLQSPDLAITEAAVGAGVTSILLYLTLHRIRQIDRDRDDGNEEEKRDV